MLTRVCACVCGEWNLTLKTAHEDTKVSQQIAWTCYQGTQKSLIVNIWGKMNILSIGIWFAIEYGSEFEFQYEFKYEVDFKFELHVISYEL